LQEVFTGYKSLFSLLASCALEFAIPLRKEMAVIARLHPALVALVADARKKGPGAAI
jgi:hypothetical protein